MRKIRCKYRIGSSSFYSSTHLNRSYSLLIRCAHLFRRLKKISQVEAAIGREQRKNDALDRKIANLKVQIDDENFNNDFLIHEEDIIRRSERYIVLAAANAII